MTQEFDTRALDRLARVFGIGSPEGQAFLDDGNISQVLEISPLSRRGLAPFKGGLFYIRMRNDHPAAGELQSFVNPYTPVNPQNGYPAVVDPLQFDVYFLGASVFTNGANPTTWAQIALDFQGVDQGASDIAAGGAIAPVDAEVGLLSWTDFTTMVAVNGLGGLTSGGVMFQAMRMRVPPQASLTFRTEVTVGAVVTHAFCAMGIFPASLGQDVGW